MAKFGTNNLAIWSHWPVWSEINAYFEDQLESRTLSERDTWWVWTFALFEIIFERWLYVVGRLSSKLSEKKKVKKIYVPKNLRQSLAKILGFILCAKRYNFRHKIWLPRRFGLNFVALGYLKERDWLELLFFGNF